MASPSSICLSRVGCSSDCANAFEELNPTASTVNATPMAKARICLIGFSSWIRLSTDQQKAQAKQCAGNWNPEGNYERSCRCRSAAKFDAGERCANNYENNKRQARCPFRELADGKGKRQDEGDANRQRRGEQRCSGNSVHIGQRARQIRPVG